MSSGSYFDLADCLRCFALVMHCLAFNDKSQNFNSPGHQADIQISKLLNHSPAQNNVVMVFQCVVLGWRSYIMP